MARGLTGSGTQALHAVLTSARRCGPPPRARRAGGVRRRRARRDDRAQGVRRPRTHRARRDLPDRVGHQADRRRRRHDARRGRVDGARRRSRSMAAGAGRPPRAPHDRVGDRRHGPGATADHRRGRPRVPARVGLCDGAARQHSHPACRGGARAPHERTVVASFGPDARRVDRALGQPAVARPAGRGVAVRGRRTGRGCAARARRGRTPRRRPGRACARATRHGRHGLLRPRRSPRPVHDCVRTRSRHRFAGRPRPSGRVVVGSPGDARRERLAGVDDRRPVGVRVDDGGTMAATC